MPTFTSTEADCAAWWPLSAVDANRNEPARSYVVPTRAAPLASVVSCRTSTQVLVPNHRACSVTARPATGVPDVVRSTEASVPDRSVGTLQAVPTAGAGAAVPPASRCSVAVPRTCWPSAWVTTTETGTSCAAVPAGQLTDVEAAAGAVTVQGDADHA